MGPGRLGACAVAGSWRLLEFTSLRTELWGQARTTRAASKASSRLERSTSTFFELAQVHPSRNASSWSSLSDRAALGHFAME
ncbi:hypothetical protein GGTG_00697 [Gaeumannomyces tritici R3-111a-1]|uniref:Uncharacterized protein n=1 Tax=Gaeumannomyces tritici (strain R3-111a-1) TaxID=644352 RepID=J3NHG0_GAET3|nr:hypothetical protein GGTG_00697 [Gaeumannomyces tritici R3-111a-1]EJT80703.1 hypothetical protein GGTG_00697 [Gaeumannomyces tritici R3-111a-1]